MQITNGTFDSGRYKFIKKDFSDQVNEYIYGDNGGIMGYNSER